MLFFCEILDFVDINDYSVLVSERADVGNNAFDVACRGGRRIQFIKRFVGLFGDYAGKRGFSDARITVSYWERNRSR